MAANFSSDIYANSRQLIAGKRRAIKNLLEQQAPLSHHEVSRLAHYAWRVSTELALLGEAQAASAWQKLRKQLQKHQQTGLLPESALQISHKFSSLI